VVAASPPPVAENRQAEACRDNGKLGGRPSKFDESCRRRLIEATAKGLPACHAARAAGITPPSFAKYRRENPEFEEQIQQAIAVAIEKRLDIIEKAMSTDASAAKWWLEHIHPDSFARNRIEISGANGSSLPSCVVFLPPKNADIIPATITDTKTNGHTVVDAEFEQAISNTDQPK
jgi:hypothetical protein